MFTTPTIEDNENINTYINPLGIVFLNQINTYIGVISLELVWFDLEKIIGLLIYLNIIDPPL